VYGAGEDHKGDQASPYHKFTEQAKKGNIVLFENSDKYKRDFIHVNDILDYHHKFMQIKESGLWNLGSGRAVSFEKVAKDIAKEYNADIRYVAMPEHLKASYQEYTCANMTKTWDTVGSPYDR
jgi:ADP-L-glycero-D-manno-heptose 6-epimerase